jgi:hypothetical protein
MSRYVRMVMLFAAGVFFMIPMLGRPAVARPVPRMHGVHGRNNMHQALEPDGIDSLADDPAAPCAEE